jgi:AcrR family transcriptional regulator
MVDSKKATQLIDNNRKKQVRGVLTRQQLLVSARVIFARDGFEHTRIEDIAAKAGKTRGAFYDHFKDKEDAFCAIFEDDLSEDMKILGPLLLSLRRVDQRIEALGDYLSKLCRDRQRILLNLEFKLYAIRHPRKRKRLADLHHTMRLRSPIPELNQFLQQFGGHVSNGEVSGSFAICGIMDGLSIGHLFDPEALDSSEIARYLKLSLKESLQATPNRKTKRLALINS